MNTISRRRSLLCVILFFISTSILPDTFASERKIFRKYPYQVNVNYKGGTKHIGRANILLPAWQREKKLLFIDVIGTFNNKKTQEANAGIGYRQMVKIRSGEFIFGSYSFYDFQSSRFDNNFHQITLGLELLGEEGEVRVNGYYPIIKTSYEIILAQANEAGISHDDKNVYFGNRTSTEYAFPGLDGEVGYKVPTMPVNIFAGYYYFTRKDVETIQGPRARAEIKFSHGITIEGEYSYDKIRKHTWFAGISLRFDITTLIGSRKGVSPFSLEGKMVQMPKRDVDIITIDKDNNKPVIIVETEEELQEAIEIALKEPGTDIGIDANLDLNNVVYTDQFGDQNNTLQQMRLAGIKVTRDNNDNITDAVYFNRTVSNFRVRPIPGASNITSISGNSKAMPGALLPYIVDSEVRNIEVDNWHIANLTGNEQGSFIGYAKNSKIYNINNYQDLDANAYGVVGIAYDTSVYNCNNRGNIPNANSSGLVGSAMGESKIEKNNNYNPITNNDSSGIIRDSYDTTLIKGNINRGNNTGQRSGSVVRLARDKVNIMENQNEGDLGGQDNAGIIYSMDGNTVVADNQNKGLVGGTNTAGVINIMGGSSVAVRNTNNRDISNDCRGIINIMNGASQASDNTNTGNVGDVIAGGPPVVGNASGIIGTMNGTSKAINNKNHGTEIRATQSSGVVLNQNNEAVVEDNENTAHINANASASTGIVRIANGTSANCLIKSNTNTGRIDAQDASGIVKEARGFTVVESNSNSGRIQGQNAGGIANQVTDDAKISFCTNTAEITGVGAAGIVKQGLLRAEVKDNRNTGRINTTDAGGIISLANGNVLIKDNTNTGSIEGLRSGGIISQSDGFSVVEDNTNLGNINVNYPGVGADGAGGIIFEATGDSTIRRNINGSATNNNLAQIIGTDIGGVMMRAEVRAVVEDNINYGRIVGNSSSGLMRIASGNANIRRNHNYGLFIGQNTQGILRAAIANVSITANENHAPLRIVNATGILRNASGNTHVDGNINRGNFEIVSATGILLVADDDATVRNNQNFGLRSGAVPSSGSLVPIGPPGPGAVHPVVPGAVQILRFRVLAHNVNNAVDGLPNVAGNIGAVGF